jgi:hypothetical protein
MARQIKGMPEEDAFTRWRHVLCYLQRPGVRSAIKRQARRRERREARASIRKET